MSEPETLSERETEILELVATGKSNKEIARELYISTNTVKVHVRNIFGKLDVASRTEASMVAVRAGLISPDGPEANEDAEGGPSTDAAPAGAESRAPAPPAQHPQAAPAPKDAAASEPASAAAPPAPAVSTRTWLIAGLFLLVTLLVIVAIDFYRPDAAAPTAEAEEPVAIESQWSELTGLPAARSRAAAAAFEGRIYLAGGERDGAPTNVTLMLDPETGAWTERAPKPSAVSDVKAAVLGGLIYVPGGETAAGEPTAALEIYDPLEDAWRVGPGMPYPLSAYALAAHEGKLYVMGGWNGREFTRHVLMFNPDTSTWIERTPAPIALGYAGAAVTGGRIYLIGGTDGEKALRSTLYYIPAQEGAAPWHEGAEMPEGRYAMGLVSIADRIHLVGGLGAEDGNFTQMDFAPQANLWQVIENPLAGEWAHVAAAALGTNIFVSGGELDGSPTDRSLSYQVLFTVVIPVIPVNP